MSSFLTATENVAQRRRKILRDSKWMGEESRAIGLALEGHSLFLVFAAQNKCFCYRK